MFISFFNVSEAVHYAFPFFMQYSIVKLHVDPKCAACVTDALVKVYHMKWICNDLFHFLFRCQVMMDSVSIVDDVGNWPPDVVQEESKE